MQQTEDLGNSGTAEQSTRHGYEAVLPPEIAPSQDFTEIALMVGAGGPFPFEGAREYDHVFDGIARLLHRGQAPHVLLVGERGVGTYAILAEFARRAAIGRPAFLSDKRVVIVDCRYVCPEESRRMIFDVLNHVGGRDDLIVAIDGFASLLRSERGSSNKCVLLAGLSRVRCRVVALLTPHEYAEVISDDPDYQDFFGKIDVPEPSPETALTLLRHYARGLEHAFGVTVEDDAIREAVNLSTAYILNDQLPAKALKILRDACEEIAYQRSEAGSQRSEVRGQRSEAGDTTTPLSPLGERGRGEGEAPTYRGDHVTADAIFRRVAQISGVPEATLRGIGDKVDYAAVLGEHIFGQEHAVNEVATELGLIKAGMTDANKPASVMLFIGMTGTGKTEMAKVLSRLYSTSKRLKTYTLGNCIEPHSVSTIIGVPPGYVGADRGGPLINDLNSDPYCVFLLDEADKAHPDVLQPFLNLFDEGWVSDHRGVKGYANNAIIILTTNVGQRMLGDMVEQKKSIEEITARMREVLSQIRHSKADRPVFTPEFLARLKRVIVFGPLDKTAMLQIACKLVGELVEQWRTKRGKRLEVPEELVTYIGEEANRVNEKSKGKEGGRIVRKLIAEWIEAKLQREIAQRPESYRASQRISLEFTPPSTQADGQPSASPQIGVILA